VIVKRDVDLALAKKYQQKFYLSGLLVKLESAAENESAVFSIDDPHQYTTSNTINDQPDDRQPIPSGEPAKPGKEEALSDLSLVPIEEVHSSAESAGENVDVVASPHTRSALVGAADSAATASSANSSSANNGKVNGADNSETEQYPEDMAFEFSGKGGEYFKIWIVNIVLSILT